MSSFVNNSREASFESNQSAPPRPETSPFSHQNRALTKFTQDHFHKDVEQKRAKLIIEEPANSSPPIEEQDNTYINIDINVKPLQELTSTESVASRQGTSPTKLLRSSQRAGTPKSKQLPLDEMATTEPERLLTSRSDAKLLQSLAFPFK